LSPLAPGTPTIGSVLPGYVAESWFAIIGPAGMPADLVARLNATINAAVQLPEIQQRFTTFGVVAKTTTPQKLSQMVAEEVARYTVRLVAASRPGQPGAPDFIDKWVKWGAGLRGSQALVKGGKARALIHGRYHVSIQDIHELAKPILRHRIMTNFYAESERINADAIIDKLIATVPLPRSGM
jgi:MoxR-like ATPase